jgi:cytochrome c-type biogenesis protein CcmH/NrfG
MTRIKDRQNKSATKTGENKMKKYTYIATLFAIILFGSASAFAQTETPKFDNDLMTEFSKGMQGDSASYQSAMAKAEKILAANPKDSQTLVWAGAATLAQSGQAFMSGNFAEGGKMWAEGRRKMDEAVSLDGENIEVLIVRGSTYISASAKYPVKEEADKLRSLGTADLEKIISSTEGKTDGKSVGIRTKAISVFVKHYTEISDKEKAESYKKMLPAK